MKIKYYIVASYGIVMKDDFINESIHYQGLSKEEALKLFEKAKSMEEAEFITRSNRGMKYHGHAELRVFDLDVNDPNDEDEISNAIINSGCYDLLGEAIYE